MFVAAEKKAVHVTRKTGERPDAQGINPTSQQGFSEGDVQEVPILLQLRARHSHVTTSGAKPFVAYLRGGQQVRAWAALVPQYSGDVGVGEELLGRLKGCCFYLWFRGRD